MHALPDTNGTTRHNEASTATTQRDEKGRFRKGNRGGPGNPYTRQTPRLRQAALEAVSEDDIHEIFNVLKDRARQGDVSAIKLLLSYSIGKPLDTPNPDTADQHELQT